MKILKKIKRKIEKNPLDKLLAKAKKENKKKILLAWNRALGDISLGLYAVVYQIKKYIPDAKITFLIREDLKEGFELLENVDFITVSFWRRYVPFDIYHTLNLLKIDHKKYDVIIDKVDPAYWVKWQLSTLVPKLKWEKKFDELYKNFNLPNDKLLIAIQTVETKHSPWRSWPYEYYSELFKKASKDIVFVLFGTQKDENFIHENVIDLRAKTSVLQALSIIKNRCSYFISLDSGLLSLFYYLNVDFPIKLLALWGSKNVGVIKQNVLSCNKKLIYVPLLYEKKLFDLKPDKLLEYLYPKDVEKFLKKNNQISFLDNFQKSSIEKKKNLINEIFLVDQKILEKQKTFFIKKPENENFLPLKTSDSASFKDLQIGKKILASRNVATIIMAAGQGTRLGFFGPKGLFEINKKTLFEYHLQKIISKQEKYNTRLYLSIMTSHINHAQILKFFEKNLYFGLEKDQVDFFIQKKAPFLDEKGNWVVENDKIAQAPDGNGSIFISFNESNILAKYIKNKIKYISVIPVDNPICDPFDEALFGFHKNNKNEITIKCIERENNNEKKGAIALKEGKIKIIEYINLDENKNYYFSNSGIYLFDIKFFQKMKDIDLNYHYVWKKISNTNEIFAYKSESFIFDSFDYAKKIKTLVDKKENFYAPIKDLSNIKEIEKLLSLEKLPENMLK
jgi:UDP-N-acetylglucosamine/UDP-N-acetylgalactosamine diphosphorylase